jgi:serine/threonine-protein kinase
MDSVRKFRESFLEAAALGLLATATLYVAPLQIAKRLDGWLFDAWTHLAPPAAPADLLLVHLDDPTGLDRVVALAREERAKLVVATQSLAPASQEDAFVLGPTELPRGESRLEPTDWNEGGHLLFQPDIDGVVRTDRAIVEDGIVAKSLAQRAASALLQNAPVRPTAARATDDAPHWLRFFSPQSFAAVGAAELGDDPARLRDKVVIVGGSEQAEITPFGPQPTYVLLANAVAGYVHAVGIAADWRGTAVAWGAAAMLLALLALPASRSRALMLAAPVTATLGMLALGTLAFRAGLWTPVVGPIAWLAIVGGVLSLRAPMAAAPLADHELVNARRAVASGELLEAWTRYRQISATSALLPELYDLACELDSGGKDQYAAELFHRIALVDGRFRDVAKRLVRSAHSAPALERESMPSTMGRYELLEPIGRGAMGFVYLGRDPKINRIVALKAVDLAAEVDPDDLDEARKNFLREAEIAGQLSHPNIVTIYDVGETDGLAYIAMEYLRGRHLSEFSTPERLLSVRVVLELLSRTADALDYAHSRNIVHRDIKPANIMYDSVSDGLKITDFGIARLIDVGRTRTGIVLGTPAFMSPEQLEGKNVNGHTDLFALGVSLYQLLTGHLPFRGASMTKLMFVIANEPHQSVTELRPDLPEHLNAVVDRALAKDPRARFQSGAEMASAMRSAAQAA